MRLFILTIILCAFSNFAYAETIGTVATKGFFLKDTLTIEAFDDPDILGITCYTTVHDRALSFDDSSSSSLSCRKVSDLSGKLRGRSNIFSRNKSLFFKKTVVDRFYDSKRGALIYLSYTKDTDGQNDSNSISVVVVK